MEGDSDTSTDAEPQASGSARRGYQFHRLYSVHTVSDSSDDEEGPPAAKIPNLGGVEADQRPHCRYGARCYRKNASHLRQFRHPDGQRPGDDGETDDGAETSMKAADDATAPAMEKYGLYLTSVANQKATRHPELSLRDILDPGKGALVASAQFSYMFEVEWMLSQYPQQFRSKPLLLVHGTPTAKKSGINLEIEPHRNITALQARLELPYGTHHTKMMLLLYEDGLRVVIHTANMVARDWSLKTQGIWMSPTLPKLAKHLPKLEELGESTTQFKRDLLAYLRYYRHGHLDRWVSAVVEHDFSQVRVHLVASCPGRFTGDSKQSFGHLRLRQLLSGRRPRSRHPADLPQWPVVAQFSSIGSLGPGPDTWLLQEWLSSAGAPGPPPRRRPQLIYPAVEDVRRSLEGYPAGGSLPYAASTAARQAWLTAFLHKWRAEASSRTAAAPHIKTYCRASPGGHRLSWFLLTSANLSKAAWGCLEKGGRQLMVRSYELGVLFLPEKFDEDYFNLGDQPDRFPLPFDLPVTPYDKADQPWIVDLPYTRLPDRHGNMWVPT